LLLFLLVQLSRAIIAARFPKPKGSSGFAVRVFAIVP
jgi:kynurenine formamidase